jgi:hypothetical protein
LNHDDALAIENALKRKKSWLKLGQVVLDHKSHTVQREILFPNPLKRSMLAWDFSVFFEEVETSATPGKKGFAIDD